jgi:hypothetical protein
MYVMTLTVLFASATLDRKTRLAENRQKRYFLDGLKGERGRPRCRKR